jgi:hypothetical protein
MGIYRAERGAARFTSSDLGDVAEGPPNLGPDCSGLPGTGEMVCDYDEGFIAGVLRAFSGREFVAREVGRWASGGRVCRFAERPLTTEHDTE